MGAPIARRLLGEGFDVTVWNRTRSAAEAFDGTGARIAGRPAEVASDVVLSVLPDVDQLESLLDDDTMGAWSDRRVTIVVVSTTSPDKVRRLRARLAPHGIRVADAPVSGGVAGAEAGTLSVMVGAEDEEWELLRPVLESIGSRVTRFGPPGAGTVAKLCNQVVVAGTLVSLAEAFSLAERSGLDAAALLETLQAGLADSAVLRAKGSKLLDGDYSLGGSARNQLKDLRYAAGAAEASAAPAPLTALLTELFERVEQLGRGAEDHAVVRELYREDAG
jgi:3-hydroxyisobutyrate dehydrogenase-like beta-hydroxyacid dehydrogenase